jgi:hypothetical protein
MRKIIGISLYGIAGLYLLITELILLSELWGLIGVFLVLTLFPILLVAMPFYALFAYGNWILLVISIATPIISGFIMGKNDE